jgi:hypothetical protein
VKREGLAQASSTAVRLAGCVGVTSPHGMKLDDSGTRTAPVFQHARAEVATSQPAVSRTAVSGFRLIEALRPEGIEDTSFGTEDTSANINISRTFALAHREVG